MELQDLKLERIPGGKRASYRASARVVHGKPKENVAFNLITLNDEAQPVHTFESTRVDDAGVAAITFTPVPSWAFTGTVCLVGARATDGVAGPRSILREAFAIDSNGDVEGRATFYQ